MDTEYEPRTRAAIAAERRVAAMVARNVEIDPKPFFKLTTALGTLPALQRLVK